MPIIELAVLLTSLNAASIEILLLDELGRHLDAADQRKEVFITLAIPDMLTPLPFSVRLEHTLKFDVIVILWLLAAVANVARLRFFSEQNIGASASETESGKVQEARAILQNTLEQVVLAVGAHLIVAASFDQSAWKIGTLVGLFSIGRLLFWIGYKH